MPGRIVSYDAASQRCSVQPMTTLRHGTDELPIPVLDDVPVCWPRGGGFVMHWPLAVGDVVDVRFSDRMLDDWRGTGQAVAPTDPRSHALADATVHPSGVWPDASPATSPALTTDLMITRDGGGGMCIKADGTVVLGDAAGGVLAQPVTLDPVLRAQLLLLLPALNALSSSLVAMQTAMVGVAALTTAPPAAAILTAASATVVAASSAAVAALSAWPAPTAATKTKAL